MSELHALNKAIATELGVAVATGEVNLLHDITVTINLSKEDIPSSAKLIAEELRKRTSKLTGIKLLPDLVGKHNFKVCVSN